MHMQCMSVFVGVRVCMHLQSVCVCVCGSLIPYHHHPFIVGQPDGFPPAYPRASHEQAFPPGPPPPPCVSSRMASCSVLRMATCWADTVACSTVLSCSSSCRGGAWVCA